MTRVSESRSFVFQLVLKINFVFSRVGKRAVPSLWRPQALWSHSVAVSRDFGYRLETPNNTSSGHMVSFDVSRVGWPVHLVELAPPSSTSWSSPDPRPHPAAGGKSRTEETAP